MAPLVALWLVLKHDHALAEPSSDAGIVWLILFGAAAMIVGLWCLGHKVISTLGEKITRVTPPR